jgi:hypothetical protein
VNSVKIAGVLGNISFRKEFGMQTAVTQFTYPCEGRDIVITLKIRSQALLRLTRRWATDFWIELCGNLLQDEESGEFYILLQGFTIPKKQFGGKSVQIPNREIVRTA